PAISGFSSVFSFMTLILPAYSVASSSTIGATIWHGPHHTAQKSTITTSFAFMTCVSQEPSSTFIACATVPSFSTVTLPWTWGSTRRSRNSLAYYSHAARYTSAASHYRPRSAQRRTRHGGRSREAILRRCTVPARVSRG